MSTLDLWELFKTGRCGPLEMGVTQPEEAIQWLGKPHSSDHYGNGPFNDWLVDYKEAELWFHEVSKRLLRVKVQHERLLKYLYRRAPRRPGGSMRVGQVDVTIADVDLSRLPSLPEAIEATRHLNVRVRGMLPTREIWIEAKNDGRRFSLDYMFDTVKCDFNDLDYGYYLYGVYVDDAPKPNDSSPSASSNEQG